MATMASLNERRKYYKGYCETCGEPVRFVLKDKDEEEGQIILRCDSCHSRLNVPVERVLKSGRLLTEDEYERRSEALSKVSDYKPGATYWVGQKIRHNKFSDVGKIIRKEKTDDEHRAIIVKFEKVGTKKLVEGLGGRS